MISGTVAADRGTVWGFQVKARDITHRITYTVFTRSGNYRIPNLLPGSYEVRVAQKGFESPVHKVELKAGQSQLLDLKLTAVAVPPSQAPWLSPDRDDVEMVDYDQLYPPGPGREALESACMSCHGRFIFHRQAWPEEVWRHHADRMSAPGGLHSPSFRTHEIGSSLLSVQEFWSRFGAPGVEARQLSGR